MIEYKRRVVELSRGEYRTLGVSIPASIVKWKGLEKGDLVGVQLIIYKDSEADD